MQFRVPWSLFSRSLGLWDGFITYSYWVWYVQTPFHLFRVAKTSRPRDHPLFIKFSDELQAKLHQHPVDCCWKHCRHMKRYSSHNTCALKSLHQSRSSSRSHVFRTENPPITLFRGQTNFTTFVCCGLVSGNNVGHYRSKRSLSPNPPPSKAASFAVT